MWIWQKRKFHFRFMVGDDFIPILLKFVSQQSGFAFFVRVTSVARTFYFWVILWSLHFAVIPNTQKQKRTNRRLYLFLQKQWVTAPPSFFWGATALLMSLRGNAEGFIKKHILTLSWFSWPLIFTRISRWTKGESKACHFLRKQMFKSISGFRSSFGMRR